MEISPELGGLILLLCISSYATIASRLQSSIITAPIVFLGIGYAFSYFGFFSSLHMEETVHLVAEIALVILLFLDASQINLKRLKYQNAWPLRMLLVGLPLCIVIGTVFCHAFVCHSLTECIKFRVGIFGWRTNFDRLTGGCF